MTQDDKILLARIDERTERIEKDLTAMRVGYVKIEEFKPVKSIVFGLTGFVLISFMGSLIFLVWR